MYRTTSEAIARQALAGTLPKDLWMTRDSERWTIRTTRGGYDRAIWLIAEMWDGSVAESFRTA